MTAPLNLDALQALCDAATQGRWHFFESGDARPHYVHFRMKLGGVFVPHYGFEDPKAPAEMLANARFIAAARSAMPALIQEVRRRGELVERAYREGLSRGFHHDDHEHVIDTDKEWKASEVHSALHKGQ